MAPTTELSPANGTSFTGDAGGSNRMKQLLRILPLLLLAGCEDSDLYRVGQIAVASLTSSAQKIPRDRPAGIPYASMGLELGDTAQVLFVLGTRMGDELDWFAGDQVFLRTRNGR